LRIIARAKPSYVELLFDKQVSRSGELAGMVRQRLEQMKLKGDAQATGGVDLKLSSFDVAASSDRAIIGRAKEIWDIPAEFLKGRTSKIVNLTVL